MYGSAPPRALPSDLFITIGLVAIDIKFMCKLTFAWFTRDVTAIIWAVCAKMFSPPRTQLDFHSNSAKKNVLY